MPEALAARARTRVAPWLAPAILIVASAAHGADVPTLSGRVVDDAAILAPATRERVAAALEAHERATGNQIAVLTTATLGGESIEDYAVRVFAAWKLGQQGKDNGVLVVVVPRDRKMRIEVGYGLEATLPDAAAGRIIDDVMKPRFKAGDYDRGVSDGVTAIVGTLEGRPDAIARQPARNRLGPVDMPLPARLIIAAVVLGILGLFTFGGILTASPAGWVIYVFLIPFWTLFPMPLFGVHAGWAMMGVYLIGFPIVRAGLARTEWYRKMRSRADAQGMASTGGFSSSAGDTSFGGSSSSGGGDFSGGGGSSGGGGASGSW
jgi:uncharacterized protein